MKIGLKMILTAAILVGTWLAARMIGSDTVQTIASADLAGLQFSHTDAAAVRYAAGMDALHALPWWLGVGALAAIALVWTVPGSRRRDGAGRRLLLLLGAVGAATLARVPAACAYFSTTE